jgi:hypothetical protein
LDFGRLDYLKNIEQFFFQTTKWLNYSKWSLLDDFYFQNDGNIQDGVLQIFNAFLQALVSFILNN